MKILQGHDVIIFVGVMLILTSFFNSLLAYWIGGDRFIVIGLLYAFTFMGSLLAFKTRFSVVAISFVLVFFASLLPSINDIVNFGRVLWAFGLCLIFTIPAIASRAMEVIASKGFLVTILIVSVLSLGSLEAIALSVKTSSRMIFLANPNAIGLLAGIVLVTTMNTILLNRKNKLYILLLLFSILVVYIADSRAVYLSVAISTLVALSSRITNSSRIILYIVFFVLLSILILIFLNVGRGDTGRFEIYSFIFDSISYQPFGAFDANFIRDNSEFDSAHNVIFGLWLNYGIISLIVFLSAFTYVFIISNIFNYKYRLLKNIYLYLFVVFTFSYPTYTAYSVLIPILTILLTNSSAYKKRDVF